MPVPRNPQSAIPPSLRVALSAQYHNIGPSTPSFNMFSTMNPRGAAIGTIVSQAGLTENYIQAMLGYPGSYNQYLERYGLDRGQEAKAQYDAELAAYKLRAAGPMSAVNQLAKPLVNMSLNQLTNFARMQRTNPAMMNLMGTGKNAKSVEPLLGSLQQYANFTPGAEDIGAESLKSIGRMLVESNSFTSDEINKRMSALTTLSKQEGGVGEVIAMDNTIRASIGKAQVGSKLYADRLKATFSSLTPEAIQRTGIARLQQSGIPASVLAGEKQAYILEQGDPFGHITSELKGVTSRYGLEQYKQIREGLGPEQAISPSAYASLMYKQGRHASDFEQMGYLETFQRFGTYATTQGFRRGAINLLAEGVAGRLPAGVMPLAIGALAVAGLSEATRLSGKAGFAGQFMTGPGGVGSFYGGAFGAGLGTQQILSAAQANAVTGLKSQGFNLASATLASSSGQNQSTISSIQNQLVASGLQGNKLGALSLLLGGGAGPGGADFMSYMSRNIGPQTNVGSIYGLYAGTYGPGANPANIGALKGIAGDQSNWMLYAIMSGQNPMDLMKRLETGDSSAFSALGIGKQKFYGMLGPQTAALMGISPEEYQTVMKSTPAQMGQTLNPQQTRQAQIGKALSTAKGQLLAAQQGPIGQLGIIFGGGSSSFMMHNAIQQLAQQGISLTPEEAQAALETAGNRGPGRNTPGGRLMAEHFARESAQAVNVHINKDSVQVTTEQAYLRTMGSATPTSGSTPRFNTKNPGEGVTG